MKRSPIINPMTDATYEQATDPAIQGYISNGSTWYNPETKDMRYRSLGEWELIPDDEELTIGDLWYNQADGKTYRWTGTSWSQSILHS